MWYASEMADNTALIGAAHDAISHAQQIRAFHRKRTHKGHPQRETDIKHARERLDAAMVPIRSELGKARFIKDEAGLKQLDMLRFASKSLQAERRKLWKLRG